MPQLNSSRSTLLTSSPHITPLDYFANFRPQNITPLDQNVDPHLPVLLLLHTLHFIITPIFGLTTCPLTKPWIHTWSDHVNRLPNLPQLDYHHHHHDPLML